MLQSVDALHVEEAGGSFCGVEGLPVARQQVADVGVDAPFQLTGEELSPSY